MPLFILEMKRTLNSARIQISGNAFVVDMEMKFMKQVFMCAAIFLLLSIAAQAQTKSKKGKSKQAVTSSQNKAAVKTTNKETASNTSSTVSLTSTSSNPAKANTNSLSGVNNIGVGNNYTVTDPILTTLDKRANGANIKFNNSGIIGMPKRAYGFANGHILLNSTGSVTSGTQTGSGAVGTGSSLATFGSIGASMNVNGKSPYAGINMWGNAMNMYTNRKDSSVRLTPLKKQ